MIQASQRKKSAASDGEHGARRSANNFISISFSQVSGGRNRSCDPQHDQVGIILYSHSNNPFCHRSELHIEQWFAARTTSCWH
jgi:hypothetical protein